MLIEWVSLMCTVSKIALALAEREYETILGRGRKDFWISPSDYRTMLRVSFPLARCCNVFINGTTHEVEQSFDDFVRSYPNDYIVMHRSYDCQGYLLIATEEKKLLWVLSRYSDRLSNWRQYSTSNKTVGAFCKDIYYRIPSSISTTELLIIFDGDLPPDSRLFNGSLYRNANVNLASTSGIWSLSENFLAPRTFEKVERYEDLRYSNGLANFKGRELQAAAYFNPPMCYLEKTTNKTVNGIEAQIFLADNDSERDGFELKIFMLIAERLNFSWTIRRPSGGYRYGRRVNSTWNGGMIGQLVNKEIDIAFSGIWLKEDHNVFTNLSVPFGELFIKFLVPRPNSYTSFWALTRPFTPLVWGLIFLMLVWQTCYMTIGSRLMPRDSTRRFRKFSNTWMELTGRLIGIWVPRKIAGAKVQLQFWQTAGLVIVAAYSSSLAARLTGQEYEDRIDTVKQFLDAGLTWGRQGPVPIYEDFFDLSDADSAMIPSRFEHEDSPEDRHRKIVEGNYAIIGRLIGGVFFPEDHVAHDDLHKYRVMRRSVGSYYSCFAMQPWLLDKINTLMLWSSESGFTSFFLSDVVRRRAGSGLREVLIEHDKSNGTARVLRLTPLASGFVMLTTGLVISSIVFYMEVRSGSVNVTMRR